MEEEALPAAVVVKEEETEKAVYGLDGDWSCPRMESGDNEGFRANGGETEGGDQLYGVNGGDEETPIVRVLRRTARVTKPVLQDQNSGMLSSADGSDDAEKTSSRNRVRGSGIDSHRGRGRGRGSAGGGRGKKNRKKDISKNSSDREDDSNRSAKRVRPNEASLIIVEEADSAIEGDIEPCYSLRAKTRSNKVVVEAPMVVEKKEKDDSVLQSESSMCRQCQRNDKGRVIRCTKCSNRRYCVPCIKNWFSFHFLFSALR